MSRGGSPEAGRRGFGERWLEADPLERGLAAFVLAMFVFLAWVALTKPHHIDDTLFVRSARALGETGDPLAFTVNWSGTPQPAAIAFTNPPGMSALVLLCERIFGPHEHSARMASILSLGLLLVALARLSAACGASRLWACALALGSPAVAVCSGSIMADTLCAAAMALGVAEWMRFTRTARISAAALAITALVLAALTKYVGLIAIAPCAIACWRSPPRRRPAVLLLGIPAVFLAVYVAWVSRVHGVGLVGASASISLVAREGGGDAVVTCMIALGFLGGAFLAGPLSASRGPFRRLAVVAVLLSTLGLAWLALVRMRLGGRYPHVFTEEGSWPAVIVCQFAVFTCLGALSIVWIVGRLVASDGTRRWVLGTWIVAGLTYFLFVNWAISVRGLLPVLPALFVCAAADPGLGSANRARTLVILVASIVVSIMLSLGDREFAIAAREDARSAAADRSAWQFQGHWGFQHYAEERGGRALDLRGGKPGSGTRVLVPMQNDIGETLPGDWIGSATRWSRTMRSPLVPLGASSGAGFYGDAFGLLPYGVNRLESLQTWVLIMK